MLAVMLLSVMTLSVYQILVAPCDACYALTYVLLPQSDALTMETRYQKYADAFGETASLLPQANEAVKVPFSPHLFLPESIPSHSAWIA